MGQSGGIWRASISIGEVAVDHMVRPDCRAERHIRRVSAANACDDPIGFERSNRGSRPRAMTEAAALAVPTPVTMAEHTVLVEANVTVAGR